ncbi:hypothetical protein FF36_05487 [Frankia torreyi]|uniref:Uncharacterized protein n=1 Tax=Frankia torreyi TaxID=1856 RepID=A0A0D8B7Z9_9ACTN|nr:MULTISPECIES: hypothetical protein [Frankia]KJE20210.1 hypothetical protein FF36_05487 [Frankia torreyi]KQM02515.1 hypothetical protein FF86_106412 [Frankia sp. CpI1-P]
MSTSPAGTADATITELLETADALLAGRLQTTLAARHRGAALVLRTALELAINAALAAAEPGLATPNMTAKLHCLHHYSTPATAGRARRTWSHLCLACHYHQYEIGPTRSQVQAWHAEVSTLATLLGRHHAVAG